MVGVLLSRLEIMLNVLAISNYRSLRNLVIPLARLNVITGANGSGKSNVYRALRFWPIPRRGVWFRHWLAKVGFSPRCGQGRRWRRAQFNGEIIRCRERCGKSR